jgi:hypothetical protein
MAAAALGELGIGAIKLIGQAGASLLAGEAFQKIRDWLGSGFSNAKKSITGGAEQFAHHARNYTERFAQQARGGFDRAYEHLGEYMPARSEVSADGLNFQDVHDSLSGGPLGNASAPLPRSEGIPYQEKVRRFKPQKLYGETFNIPQEFAPPRPSNVTEFGNTTGDRAVGQRVPPVPAVPFSSNYPREISIRPPSRLEHGLRGILPGKSLGSGSIPRDIYHQPAGYFPMSAAERERAALKKRTAAMFANYVPDAVDYLPRRPEFGNTTGDRYVPRQAPFPGPVGSPIKVEEKPFVPARERAQAEAARKADSKKIVKQLADKEAAKKRILAQAEEREAAAHRQKLHDKTEARKAKIATAKAEAMARLGK